MPQHLLALALLVFVFRRIRNRSVEGGRTVYFCFLKCGGVSLGDYVFVHQDANELLVRHELGHCRQSFLFGPLYLLIVGVPSFVWAGLFPLLTRLNPGADYYSFFTERWANRLAGLLSRDSGEDSLP